MPQYDPLKSSLGFRMPQYEPFSSSLACGHCPALLGSGAHWPDPSPTPQVIFVELMCTDQELIRSNIMRKVHAEFGEVRFPGERTPTGARSAEWRMVLSETNVT